MNNTLKERERIINSQGCVRKKERQNDISRDARCNVSFSRFPNPHGFICFTRRPVIISRDKLLLRPPPCMRVGSVERTVVVVVLVPVSPGKRSSGCVRVFLNSKILVMTGSLIVYREHEVG